MKRTGSSLRERLVLHLWGPLLAVVAAGAVGGYVVARHIGNSVHDQWLLDSALTLGSQVKGRDGLAVLELPAPALEMFEWDRVDRIFEEVTTAGDRVLLRTAPFSPPPDDLVPGRPRFRDDTIQGSPVRVVSVLLERPAGTADPVRVQVAETLRKRNQVAESVIGQLVPLQAIILLLVGAIVWIVVTRNVRRVADIAKQLEGYRADDLAPVATTESTPSEIRPLTDAINSLIGRLQENRDAQRRFVANAAHQLRTPLAALQVQAQRALREAHPDDQRDALEDLHRAVSRLHHIAHQLLTLMRSEGLGDGALALGDVDLAAVARDAVEAWTDAALERDIDLGYNGPEHAVMVKGEAHLLRELIGNLLDNAIRYGRAGGTVTLSVLDSPLRLYVDDDGAGIPLEERELVLERFYRGRSADTQGCGLGLPIAREIARRHSAKLVIESAPGPTGLRVGVIFPA